MLGSFVGQEDQICQNELVKPEGLFDVWEIWNLAWTYRDPSFTSVQGGKHQEHADGLTGPEIPFHLWALRSGMFKHWHSHAAAD